MSLSPGTRLGKYTVRRKLAEGGMAEIFLCAAEGPEGFAKDVVVKRVRPFLTDDPAFISMFIDEARLASRLTHPNVVQIFDFDRHGDTYYLAMEYVRGASLWELRERCRAQGRSMPALLVAHLGAEVARALAYAHQLADGETPLNVVHRDVTPHNVLISFEGAIKLGDFGIARAGKASTAPGMLKGKFAYMAPEQARGEAVDGRCDVFALGVVLWELLTGGRPFEAESDLGVLRAVQQRAIPPPRRLNPEVPEALDAAVMRALERDLDRRWPDARSFGRALEHAVMQHRQAPEDTDIAAYLVEVLGPPPSTLAAPPRADTGDPAPGTAEASPRPSTSAPARTDLPEQQPPATSSDASPPDPRWGVSEPTPALRRRSTSDTPAAAFLLDPTWAGGSSDEDPGVPSDAADAGTSERSRAEATLTLRRDGPGHSGTAPSGHSTGPRPKAGRIVVVCVSALVMAGPALFLMNRVMSDQSGKGVATALGGNAPVNGSAADDAAEVGSGPESIAVPDATASGGAGSRPSADLTDRAPSLTAQALVGIAGQDDASGEREAGNANGDSSDSLPSQGSGVAALPSGVTSPSPPGDAALQPTRSASRRLSGVLVIDVFPEAQLEIDGESRGRVRGRQSFRLAPGPHTVRLIHPHRSERFEVELRKGATSTLRFNAFHVDPR